MPPLPRISGPDCIRALERGGYQQARQKGSHVRCRHPDRPPVTVPLHDQLDRGTLRAIIRDAGFTVEEFLDLLD